MPPGRNQHQPSRGIETTAIDFIYKTKLGVEININPVEGLKLSEVSQAHRFRQCRNQHQPSRGIETVIDCMLFFRAKIHVEININPVEGLKPDKIGAWCKGKGCRNQHQPSRGIETLT